MTWWSAAGAAVLTATILLALLVATLVGIRRVVAAVLGRVNGAAWEREWAEVEPGWSGRASTG